MLKFDNTNDFFGKIDLAQKQTKEIALDGLMIAGNAIMRESKEECPIKTGALVKTGMVNKDDNGVVLSYNTKYAVRVHEHPEFNFRHGKKAKYLEDPIKRGGENVRTGLITALKRIY